jgi:hypothetical protein
MIGRQVGVLAIRSDIREGRLTVTVPETVETSAEALAAALAAA